MNAAVDRLESLVQLLDQLSDLKRLEAAARARYQRAKDELDRLFDSRTELEDAIARLEDV